VTIAEEAEKYIKKYCEEKPRIKLLEAKKESVVLISETTNQTSSSK
jgi:hypothetical protein